MSINSDQGDGDLVFEEYTGDPETNTAVSDSDVNLDGKLNPLPEPRATRLVEQTINEGAKARGNSLRETADLPLPEGSATNVVQVDENVDLALQRVEENSQAPEQAEAAGRLRSLRWVAVGLLIAVLGAGTVAALTSGGSAKKPDPYEGATIAGKTEVTQGGATPPIMPDISDVSAQTNANAMAAIGSGDNSTDLPDRPVDITGNGGGGDGNDSDNGSSGTGPIRQASVSNVIDDNGVVTADFETLSRFDQVEAVRQHLAANNFIELCSAAMDANDSDVTKKQDGRRSLQALFGGFGLELSNTELDLIVEVEGREGTADILFGTAAVEIGNFIKTKTEKGEDDPRFIRIARALVEPIDAVEVLSIYQELEKEFSDDPDLAKIRKGILASGDKINLAAN